MHSQNTPHKTSSSHSSLLAFDVRTSSPCSFRELFVAIFILLSAESVARVFLVKTTLKQPSNKHAQTKEPPAVLENSPFKRTAYPQRWARRRDSSCQRGLYGAPTLSTNKTRLSFWHILFVPLSCNEICISRRSTQKNTSDPLSAAFRRRLQADGETEPRLPTQKILHTKQLLCTLSR